MDSYVCICMDTVVISGGASGYNSYDCGLEQEIFSPFAPSPTGGTASHMEAVISSFFQSTNLEIEDYCVP
jgi:hypothetical protein